MIIRYKYTYNDYSDSTVVYDSNFLRYDIVCLDEQRITGQTTQRHISEDLNLQQLHCENFKCHFLYFYNFIILHSLQEPGPGQRSQYKDSLRAGRAGNRIHVGATYSVPVQTGCGAHPVFCTVEIGSLPQGQSGRGMTLTTQPIQRQAEETINLYLYSASDPSWTFTSRDTNRCKQWPAGLFEFKKQSSYYKTLGSAGLAMGWKTQESWFDSPQGQRLFSKPCRMILTLTRLRLQTDRNFAKDKASDFTDFDLVPILTL